MKNGVLVSFILAILIMAGSTMWVVRQIGNFQDFQMDRDEAAHALRGLNFASAVQRGSFTDLWQETIRPDWYPPFYGTLLGAWFLAASPSTETARSFAAVCYFLVGILFWLAAKQAFPKLNPLLYLLPTLFLVAEEQHLVHAGMSMLEMSATLFTLAALYFFIKSVDHPNWITFFLTSLFGLACFLIRYSHGIFLFASLAVCTLIFLPRQFKGKLWLIITAWAPTAIILLAWFFLFDQWQWLLAYADVQSLPTTESAIRGYIYYPMQLLQEPSGWLALILAAVAGFSWIKRRRIPSTNIPYLVYFIVCLVFLSSRTHNIARFGMVLFPPLWIIASGGAQELLALIKNPRQQQAAVLTCLAVLLGLGMINNYTLADRLITAYENMNSAVNDAYDFIADQVDLSSQPDLRLVMYGENDNWNAFALQFFLQSQCMQQSTDCQVTVTGERELNKGWPPSEVAPEVREENISRSLAAADVMVIFAKDPVIPVGWSQKALQQFQMERFKVKPTTIQVMVLERE